MEGTNDNVSKQGRIRRADTQTTLDRNGNGIGSARKDFNVEKLNANI